MKSTVSVVLYHCQQYQYMPQKLLLYICTVCMYCIVDSENTSNEASADIDNYERITQAGEEVTEGNTGHNLPRTSY